MEIGSKPSAVESNALLKDLLEKKQNLRRIASEVGSMASELREVRGRMSVQEAALQQETTRRQAAESEVKTLEEELGVLKKHLEEQSSHAMSMSSVAEQYLKELVELRAKHEAEEEYANISDTSAAVAQLRYESLLKDVESRNQVLQENEVRASKLGEQLVESQHELRLREATAKQLSDEMEMLKAQLGKELEGRKLLEETAAWNADLLAKHLSAKDDEIARLREEIKLLSVKLKQRSHDLESQIEKHHAADQDLKKRIIKLEFWLQEARAQARKLQRVAERRENELKRLRTQLANGGDNVKKSESGLMSSSSIKIAMSVAVIALAILVKR